MNVTVIGIGLIGGSMAMALKEKGLARHVTGVDDNPVHRQRAMELGLVDEVAVLETAIPRADLVILAIPVNAAEQLIFPLLDLVDRQVVMDVGSTKQHLCRLLKDHPKRSRFVATHPMWGTEHSGPDAAVTGAFRNKAAVICNRQESEERAVEMVENLYRQLGMHILHMDAQAHDLHAAYVSHISHITSFALANTVLEKEKEEDTIFELASGGFESTVRLAKSNPSMWVPIFMQNRENVLDVLNEHISQLKKIRSCLEKENYTYLQDLIEQANQIRRILK